MMLTDMVGSGCGCDSHRCDHSNQLLSLLVRTHHILYIIWRSARKISFVESSSLQRFSYVRAWTCALYMEVTYCIYCRGSTVTRLALSLSLSLSLFLPLSLSPSLPPSLSPSLPSVFTGVASEDVVSTMSTCVLTQTTPSTMAPWSYREAVSWTLPLSNV